MASPAPSPYSTLLFASELVRIGRFAVGVGDPHFRDAGCIGDRLELVFPTLPVTIEQEGSRPFVADASCVVWYRPWQRFERAPLDPEGDRCYWFAFEVKTVESALGARHAAASGCLARLPAGRTSDCGTDVFLDRARLVRRLAQPTGIDPLRAEELTVDLLSRLLAGPAPRPTAQRPSPSERRLAEHARQVLARRYAERLTLSDLGREVGCSPFHLARAFRRATGASLHAFQTRLRLRRAVDRLDETRGDLTGLALDLGFSSHSHFTAAFKRVFGVAPSRFGA